MEWTDHNTFYTEEAPAPTVGHFLSMIQVETLTLSTSVVIKPTHLGGGVAAVGRMFVNSSSNQQDGSQSATGVPVISSFPSVLEA